MAVNEYFDLIQKESSQAPEKISPRPIAGDSNEYDSILAGANQEVDQSFVANQMVAENSNPDVKAEAIKLANKYKVAPSLIESDIDFFKDKEKTDNLRQQANLDLHPKLKQFMVDPDNAVLAYDDIDNLKRIDDRVSRIRLNYGGDEGITTLPGEFYRAGKTGYHDLMASFNHLFAAYNVLDPEVVASSVADQNKAADELRDKAPNYVKEFRTMIDAESSDVNKAWTRFTGSYDAAKREGVLQGLKDFVVGGATTVGQSLDLAYNWVTSPRAAAYTTTESLAFSSPAVILGASGAATAGPVGFAAGTFAGSVFGEVGAYINQSLQERGYNVKDPASIRKAYNNPELMAEIRAEAERKGVTTAMVESLVSFFGGKAVAKAKGAGQTVRALGKELATETIGEFAGEAGGQFAAKKDISQVNIGESIIEGLSGLGQSSAQIAIGASFRSRLPSDPVDAAIDLSKETNDVVVDLDKIAALKEVGEIASESKLNTRLPEKVGELVNTLVEGSESNEVYFQSSDFDDFFNNRNENPLQMANELLKDNGAEYISAKENDGLIKVPISKMVEAMASNENMRELVSQVRMRPDGLTIQESQQYLADLPSTFKEIADEAKEFEQGIVEVDKQAREIKKNIKEQLIEAGTPGREADLMADVYESAFKSLADRTGLSPNDLANRYQINIQVGSDEKASSLKQDGKNPRGQFFKGPRGEFNIELLQGANRSTFLHETGHLFYEVMRDLSSQENAPQQIIDDYSSIKEWLGIEGDAETTVEQHEQFARGFEAYLMEGKAPSEKLRKAFSAFKTWLVGIYRKIRNLDVDLSQDVRDVFERMLATDNEIQSASKRINAFPLFAEPENVGMSPKKASQYREALRDAKASAFDELSKKVMATELKKQSKEYLKRFKEEKQRVKETINNHPIYAAINAIKTSKMADGTELNGGQSIKINKSDLERLYTKEFIQGKLKQHQIYTTKGGLPLDVVSSLFGYQEPNDLIQSIASMPKENQYVEIEATRRLLDEFPDILVDGSVRAEADKAVHNIDRSKVLRLELEHLTSNNLGVAKEIIKGLAKRIPPDVQVKEQAKRIISKQTVGSVKPNTYLRAESRYAKEAGEKFVKGDIQGSFDSKLKELLNHELYREAVSQKEFVEKSINKFKKLKKPDSEISKYRNIDLVNAARAYVAQIGFGKKDKTPSQYLASVKEYDVETYKVLTDLIGEPLNVGNYTNLTVDQFKEVRDTFDAIWDLSKSTKEVEIDGKKLDIDKVVIDLVSQLDKVSKKKFATLGKFNEVTKQEQLTIKLLGLKSKITRMENLFDLFDRGDRSGVFKKYLWNPISEASDRYRSQKEIYIKKFRDELGKLKGTLTGRPIMGTEIGYKFANKGELIGALLHTGNQSNLMKLLVGRNWGMTNTEGVLDTSKWDAFIKRMHDEKVLTKKDWDFVQTTWDMLEELKPRAQKAHKQMFGFYFNEVTADKFETPFGEYRGGYFPAKLDPNVVENARIYEDADEVTKFNNSFAFPTSGKGATITRIEQSFGALSLDLRLATSHIDWVLRFSELEPQVRMVHRITSDKNFKPVLAAVDPTLRVDAINPWLQRAATQKVEMPVDGVGGKAMGEVARFLRRNTALQIMVGNVTNTLQQFTGISIAAIKVKPRHLRDSLWTYVRQPKVTADLINEKSEFMRGRTATQIFDVQNDINQFMLEPSKYDSFREFTQRHAYFMQQFTQNIVDNVTWLGAYEQAVENKIEEKEAIRAANEAVRLTQGSFAPEDVSSIETGTPFSRFFLMFYSYFNMQANLLGGEFTKIIQDMGLKKGAGKLLYLYTFGFMIPAFMSELIVKSMSGDFDEDDDDEYMDDVLEAFFFSQLRTGAATIPYAGQVATGFINSFNDKVYDDRISTSPAISMLEASVKTPVNIYKALAEGKNIKGAARDTLNTLGLFTGIPLGPVNKPLGYILDVDQGKIEPPTGPIDLTRGLITGKGDRN